MKKRMFSLFLALALCLSLLPATAWAAGETVPSNVTLAGTALESGKSYVATVDGITEKTGESVETNYLTYADRFRNGGGKLRRVSRPELL